MGEVLQFKRRVPVPAEEERKRAEAIAKIIARAKEVHWPDDK